MKRKSYSVLFVIMLLTVATSSLDLWTLGSNVHGFAGASNKTMSVTPMPLYFVATETVRYNSLGGTGNCCVVDIIMNISSYPLSTIYREALGLSGDINQTANVTIPQSMEVPWQINNETSFPDAKLTTTLPGGVQTSIATNSSYSNTPDGTTITAHNLHVKNETNQSIRQPVRDQFLDAVEQEQKHFLGIHVYYWSQHEMWGVGDQCFVHLVGSGAYLQVVDSGVIAVGPKNVDASFSRAGFVMNKIGFIQLMLANLNRTHNQEYTFNNIWTTNFILENTVCNNTEELFVPPKQWAVDFGNGTHMEASILGVTSQNVLLRDTLVVTNKTIARNETDILEDGLLCYNVFNIETCPLGACITGGLPSPPPLAYLENAHDEGTKSDNWGWGRRIHLWDGEFTLAFTGITFDVKTSLDLEVQMRWKFEWFKLKYAEAWMKLTAALLVNMTVGYEFFTTWEKDFWSKTLCEWNTTYKFWVGPVPVVAELTFTPIITISVGLTVTTNVVCGVNATGSLTAGAGWKRGKGWYLIYDAEMHLNQTGPDLEEGLEVDVGVQVTPSVKFRLALIFYYSAGPFVEFEPYIKLGANYRYKSETGKGNWSWWIQLGFNVNVGITFTGILEEILKLSDYERTLWNRVLWMCCNCTPAKMYDVELTEIRVPERRKAFVGQNISICADVVNKGYYPEDVNVTLYMQPEGESEWTRIGGPLQKQDLQTGNWTTFEFTWITNESLASGNYSVRANATIVSNTEPPEALDDNSKEDWTMLEIQDVTILNVTTNTNTVVEGQPVNINVTVKNTGTDVVSALPVSVCYNSNLIGDIWCEHTKWIFDLAVGSPETLCFTWDTMGVANGTYKIEANATVLPYETDARAVDNTMEDGYVTVIGRWPTDIAKEYGMIDIVDLVTVAIAFGAELVTNTSLPEYGFYLLNGSIKSSIGDIDGDGLIDIVDIVKIALDFGEKYFP